MAGGPARKGGFPLPGHVAALEPVAETARHRALSQLAWRLLRPARAPLAQPAGAGAVDAPRYLAAERSLRLLAQLRALDAGLRALPGPDHLPGGTAGRDRLQ